jgi:carboxyl-terminal processing protease
MGPAGDSLLINEVYADSPAAELGLVPGDEIIAVGGELVAVLGYYEAVDRARGEEYTRVDLTVRQGADGKVVDVQAIRRTVAVESVRSERLGDNGDVGYVRVRNFNTRVDDDFIAAVDRLLEAEVRGIIFDMRNNPGGELNVLLPMLDKLLPGPDEIIITLRSRSGREDIHRTTQSGTDLPMVVLINEGSYSAAEFFAAALKEYDKALLVGQKTSGKGYSQMPAVLDDGSAVLLSTSEYFTPSGKSLAGSGVEPDVTAAQRSPNAFFAHDHANDTQMQRALNELRRMLPPVPGE